MRGKGRIDKGKTNMTFRGLAVLLHLFAFVSSAQAQVPQQQTKAQTDWPCVQVRVPEIALGGVWSGPPIDAERKAWRDDSMVAELVARIAPRRTPLEEADKLIGEFAKSAGDKRKARLTLLVAGVYDRMNDERRDVVNGLDRFGRRLKDMAAQARADMDALHEAQGKSPQDIQAIQKMSETLQWRLRVFDEQKKMIQYVCESPALIEQRLGALARTIESAIE